VYNNEGIALGLDPQLTKGRCKISSDGSVVDHTFKDLEDPGVFEGYSDAKVKAHIEQLKARGVLGAPVDHEQSPCEPTKSVHSHS
jgi:hypothetical protein